MPCFTDQKDPALADLLVALRREARVPNDPKRALQDRQVHQIELELQNRELREAQQVLEQSRDHYVDLYDFAPVGYATVTRGALITQMNLAAARLLGVERGQVPDPYLGARLVPEDGRVLLASLARVLATGRAESVDVRLGRVSKTRYDLQLLIRPEHPGARGEPPTACYVALLDVTDDRRTHPAILAHP